MLKVGDKAPAFNLTSDSGKKIALKDLKGKTVILYFYPRDMTPGCTTQACEFRDNMSKLKRKKTVVLGVSADSVERHGKFRDKYDLNFPLLADEDKVACKAYGVWKQKMLYGKKFMGILRTTFIIDPKGKIAQIFPRVKVKGHVEAVVEAL